MKITCQSCQSKYTVSDEKVQGKTVKIKCRKCGATIIVNVNYYNSNSCFAFNNWIFKKRNGNKANPFTTNR